MEINDKWAELRKPLSMRKLTAEQMCNEFLTELQVANKNLQYNKHMFDEFNKQVGDRLFFWGVLILVIAAAFVIMNFLLPNGFYLDSFPKGSAPQ